MTKTTTFLTGVCFGLGLCFGFDTYHQSHVENPSPSLFRDTTYDTVIYRLPVPYDSAVIRYITKELHITDTITDSIVIHTGDSLAVTIPITQKQYQDSAFTAWISGYEVNLDSINVYSRTYTKTILQPAYTSAKPKRWGLGVQLGAGITPDKITPYVGVGVSYNLITW